MLKRVILIQFILFLNCNIFGVNDKIFSPGTVSVETLAQFLASGNSDLGDELVNEFATIYIEEARHEGINWDIAFVQMCLETGFLKYGGLVETGQNNFCGLGSYNDIKGASFPTIREGVRAHVQHLKAYASTEELKGELLDPRFHLVQRGSAQSVEELSGRWAEDPKYGVKLLALLKRINRLESGDVILRAEVPGELTMVVDSIEVVDNLEDSPFVEETDLVGQGWLR